MADLVYTNSIARSLENSLLGSEKITRMVFADSYEDALKVLAESGFGGGITDGGYEAMIKAEEDKLAQFMSTSKPGKGVESFTVRNDYHNAKALMKAKYGHIDDISAMLAPKGNIDVDELKDAVMNDEYNALPPYMAQALKDVDYAYATSGATPKFIDERIDKAMYAHAIQIARAGKTDSIIRYWTIEIDYANVSAFLRCRLMNRGEKYFRAGFIDGGSISVDVFESLYEEPSESFYERMKYTDVAHGIAEYVNSGGSFARLEACKDNVQLQIFKQDRYNLFCVAPVAGYYIAKKSEIKAVRMIAILLKINADKALIKERLREFYV